MTEDKTNHLYRYSIRRPWVVVIVLFLCMVLLKYLDNFAFRFDELVGESILTKGAGLILVFIYLRLAGRRMRDIGFRKESLGFNLLISGVGFLLVYAIATLVQLVVFRTSGEDASLAISATDPKTGMTGGLMFGLWMFAANLINSAMEEGLFRGIMMRHLMIKTSGWGAILISAGFFAIWHLGWPLRHYLDGVSSMGEAAFEAFGLMLATFIAGLVYGYLYLKTNNLWGPFLGHTINNTLLNILFFKIGTGSQPAASFMIFQIIFIFGYLPLIPVFKKLAEKRNLPELEPWGAAN